MAVEAFMAKDLAQVEREALQLPEEDRARLAENLLHSLSPGEDVDAEHEWLAEAERRYRAYREGKMTARTVSDVLREARKKLG
jgi:putative addiction module component (TIGR02574 family)